MAFKFEVRNSHGRVVGGVMTGCLDRLYRLADGSAIPVYPCIAWCGRCHKFVEAERLKSLEEIEEEFARFRSGDTRYRRAIAGITRIMGRDPFAPEYAEERRREMDRAEVAELTVMRAWRLSRQSPPRCLRCGSTDVRPVSDRSKDLVRNPDTGEVVKIVWTGHCSLANRYYFTPEGLPMRH